jgi:hypothetical protein
VITPKQNHKNFGFVNQPDKHAKKQLEHTTHYARHRLAGAPGKKAGFRLTLFSQLVPMRRQAGCIN